MKTKYVVVKPYDPKWPIAFNTIKKALMRVLKDDNIHIEHIGSTSVEGLAAKPIIDIDIVIESMNDFKEIKENLEANGYIHEGNLGISGREAFAYTTSPYMKHHLYVCPKNSIALKEHRFFKSFLQAHDDLKDEYSEIKRAASKKHPYDIDAYMKEKDPFIKNILRKMEENNEKRVLL